MRLIDADALIQDLEDMAALEWNKRVGVSQGLEDAIDIIEDFPTITPGGRYNGKRSLSLLSEIEKIARDAFNDPETLDINLYRAQALARIFQLFEYNNEEAADNDEQGSN